MNIQCHLFLLINQIKGCYGDFVDSGSVHRESEHMCIFVTNNKKDVEAIAAMFGLEADNLYFPDRGVNLDITCSGFFILTIGVYNNHLQNLKRLRDSVNKDLIINQEKIDDARSSQIL